MLQLLILAGIAVFLIMRLRNVLGTRDGFEREPEAKPATPTPRRAFEVIDGGEDQDITDHAPAGSTSAKALAEMKHVEPGFGVSDFLNGARGAYEWILMGFERGDIDELVPFLSRDVFESFDQVIRLREREGLKVEASFVGIREVSLQEARFDLRTREAEITVRFVGELTSVVRNAAGEVVDGDPNTVKQQRDTWTFARVMGSDNPNWKLVATD